MPYVILNDFLNASIDASSLRDLGAELAKLAADCFCCDESDSLTPPDMDVARLRAWLQSLPSDVLRASFGNAEPAPAFRLF